MFGKINKITNSKCLSRHCGNIKEKNGNIVFIHEQQIASRWVDYIKETVRWGGEQTCLIFEAVNGNKILKRKFRKGNKVMKD